MTAWWTETTYLPIGTEPDEESLAAAVAGLPGFGIIQTGPAGVTITATLDAATMAAAATATLDAATAAAATLGTTAAPIGLRVLDAAQREAELDRPAAINLVGITEIADILGVTRQRTGRITELADFPPPVGATTAGRVWSAESVDRFAERWQRQPGRPAKP